MTTVQSNYGLTAQGNQYQKATRGQKIGKFLGAAPGAICTAAAIGTTIGDSIKLRGDKKTALVGAGIGVAMSAIAVGGTVLGGVLGKMIGGLFDIQATKENMAQADGEAALKEKNYNITA